MKSGNNIRADIRMVELGLAVSRERARSLIMSGVVYKNGIRIDKAGAPVSSGDLITVKEDPIPFVSRGGLKLKKAIDENALDLTGCFAADIGASTGGFTDCMLTYGAEKVFAVDVGYGQLDWKLRNDPRVIVLERHNARNMEPSWYEGYLDFASVDVSFISLKLILAPLYDCLKQGGIVVALVKPQFEAGRDKVGKNGVVRSPETHRGVLTDIALFSEKSGYAIIGMDYSPITGPKGNIEFLLILKKDRRIAMGDTAKISEMVTRTVDRSHDELAAKHCGRDE